MAYNPAPTLTIGGVDYTGKTLETVRVTRGRDDVFAEPRAGYLFCELIDPDGNGIDADILDDVVLTVQDSTDTSVTLFTGSVSDWSAVLYDPGTETGTGRSIVTIIAVGPLATLNRRNVAVDGLPQQADGDRIAALVAAGLARSWEETAGTWATVGTSTSTWDTIDTGYDPDLIDTPGVYQIAALDAEVRGYNPLREGYLTALSGRGILYDTADGYVAYQDANARENAAANDGYLDIPSSALVASGIKTASSFTDIVNRVTVTIDAGQVRISDAESILEYQVLSEAFELNLANLSTAEDWALDYLEDHYGPTINLDTITIRLDGITDDTLRDDLVNLDVNAPVSLEGIPSTMGITDIPAFVEGIEWRINRETVELRLNVSDAALSVGSIRWNLVPQTFAWDDAAATLTWEQARSL
jgi:hypothetical protein